MRPLPQWLLYASRLGDLPVQRQESRQTGGYIPHLLLCCSIGYLYWLLVFVTTMIFYCTLGAIFLGIVLALFLFLKTKNASISINIDIKQDDDTEL
jgi:hypothetical protein